MAVEAHCLLPVRGRGVAEATETKQMHGDCVVDVDLTSTRHDAVGPAAYVVASTEAGSGAAFFVNAAASSRKRSRGDEDQFVGAAKRQVIDAHRAVLHHVQKLNAEVQQWRRYAAVANAAVAGQLRAKDEEIDKARWLNRLLQEQVHTVHAEAQAWRDAAMSSDAAVAALRADLYHALCAQARTRDEAELAAAEDAESCCSGNNINNNNGEEGDDATAGSSVASECRGCGDRDAAVVLLPCRHLSACAACAAVARACPACGLPKAGSVAIKLL